MYAELSKSRCRVIASLGQKKMRLRHGLFLIEGRKSVEDILFRYPEKFEVRYVAALPSWLDEFAGICRSKCSLTEENLFSVTPMAMREITSLSTPSDVVAVCALSSPEIPSMPLAPGLYIMLDGIQDPGNLGTIIRTAHWFGVHRVFCSPGTVDIFNPKALQSAMGSMAAVDVIYTDLAELSRLNPDIPLAGLMLDGKDLFRTELPQTAFILMGNEGNGVSETMQEKLDVRLTIPPFDPSNHSESLNVAVATAITLAQFRK